MNMIYKNRTIGFWLGAVVALGMLIANIVYLIVDGSDKTFSFVTFGAILVGVAVEILHAFTSFGVLRIVTAAAYGIGLSYHLLVGLPSISDKINGVNFIGGNASMAIIFSIVFAVGTIGAVVASFLKDSKSSFEVETH